MKTSPGPWKFGYTDNLEHPIITGANGEIVCVMREGVSTEDGKLLAKAPELLEALKVLATAAGDTGNPASRAQDRTNTTQPEALRLADAVERFNRGVCSQAIYEEYCRVARELRRLYARVQELEEMLRREVQHSAEPEAARIAELKGQLEQANSPKPVNPIIQMIRDQAAEKAVLVAKGVCPTCKGKGECGGQFTGGEWVCEDCNGSGRTK